MNPQALLRGAYFAGSQGDFIRALQLARAAKLLAAEQGNTQVAAEAESAENAFAREVRRPEMNGARSFGAISDRAQRLITRAILEFNRGNTASALTFALQAADVAKREGDEASESTAWRIIDRAAFPEEA